VTAQVHFASIAVSPWCEEPLTLADSVDDAVMPSTISDKSSKKELLMSSISAADKRPEMSQTPLWSMSSSSMFPEDHIPVAKPVDSSCMLVIASNTGLLEDDSSLSGDHFLQHAGCLRGCLPLQCRCWNAMCDKFTSYHSIVRGIPIPREYKPAHVLSSGGRAALSSVCLDINIKQMSYAMLMSSVSVSLKDRSS